MTLELTWNKCGNDDSHQVNTMTGGVFRAAP
jgi:hypothetical protein